MTDREKQKALAREIMNTGMAIMTRAASVSAKIELGKDPADKICDLDRLAADVRGRVKELRKLMVAGGADA